VKSFGLPFKRLKISVKDNMVTTEGEMEKQEHVEKIVFPIRNVEGADHEENKMEIIEPTPLAQLHTVVSADNLSKISKKFYSDPNRYVIIIEAN